MAGTAATRADAIWWAVDRIRERPAYQRLRELRCEADRLTDEFSKPLGNLGLQSSSSRQDRIIGQGFAWSAVPQFSRLWTGAPPGRVGQAAGDTAWRGSAAGSRYRRQCAQDVTIQALTAGSAGFPAPGFPGRPVPGHPGWRRRADSLITGGRGGRFFRAGGAGGVVIRGWIRSQLRREGYLRGSRNVMPAPRIRAGCHGG